jgi:DNA-binding NtrC family response regulator
VFRVYLPALAHKRPLTKTETPSVEQYQGHGERILIVEDEPLVRELTSKALREHGYTVFAAANASQAIALFDAENEDFALVFSDIGLPGDCGLTLVDELCGRKPGLPVLLSSGYADTKAQWAIIRSQQYPFLHKPYALRDLLQAIKQALKQHS